MKDFNIILNKEIIIIFTILIITILSFFFFFNINYKKYEEIKISLYKDVNNILGISPYKDKIEILEFNSSSIPYILISANKNNTEAISLYGFAIEVGDNIYKINNAVLNYIHGEINEESIINLWPEDKMFVSFSNSPFGYSFLINICSGYLDQYQEFSPPLTKNCPILRGIIKDECRYIVSYLDNCRSPYNIGIDDIDCVVEVSNSANYNSCFFSNSKRTEKFYEKEWRVFVGQLPNKPLVISLYDSEHLLVDSIKLDIQ